MATPANSTEFLELVHKSGVADEKKLDAYLLKLRSTNSVPADIAKLAGMLVRDGLLTQFQAEQLLQGKWKRFSIGKYKVLEMLGKGGMSSVFLCEHKLMRRRVAVKVLPTAKAADEESLKRFYREARAVAALDHPNIVHAYDIDQDDNLHFIVMEYVDGTNLQDLVKRLGPLPIAQACHYIRQTALGLEHAHLKHLVHRDIKPGNILVDRKGQIKILDMGLARFFNDEDDLLTKKFDDNVLGTADYLAPEQAEDSHDVDIRADIYSLGATFYYLLTGKTPYGDGTVAQKLMWHRHRQPRPIHELRQEVPAGLWAIITKMMAKDAAQRYQVPRELADALAPFVQTPIAPPPESEMPKLSPAAIGPGSSSQVSPRSDSSLTVTKPTVPNFAAQPTHAQAAPVAAVKEATPFDGLADETVDTVARQDTPSQSSRPRGTRRQTSERRRLVLVVGGVSIFFLVILGYMVYKYVLFQPRPVVVSRPPLEVSKQNLPNGYKTIDQALRYARSGDVIRLLDEVHEENLEISPGPHMISDVTVEAAPGKEVRWTSANKKDDAKFLIFLSKAKNFRLRGRNITLDGNLGGGKQLRDLIFISGTSPGLTLEDLNLQGFARTAITLMNTEGSSANPIRLINIQTTTAQNEKPLAGIYFDVNPAMQPTYNDFIDIGEGTFNGLDPSRGVKRKDNTVVGKHINYSFR